MRVTKMLGIAVQVVSLAFLVWVFASWIDVAMHNLSPEPVYQIWNFFTIMF